MSGFSAEWLALRNAADARARDVALESLLVGSVHAPGTSAPAGPGQALPAPASPLVCVDLACGAGANVRRLAPLLPGAQHWRLADADASLLAHAHRACHGLRSADGVAVVVECIEVDLAHAPLAPLLQGAALVSASALLDLVSAAWLERLADAVVDARALALFVLDYDGRRECVPHDPTDARAHAAFDRHQRTAKSFGVALGPAAAANAARAFAARGCEVRRARSDWLLGSADADLQRELLRGWREAATAVDPHGREAYTAWCERRLAQVDAGTSRLRVGHEDLLVAPPGRQITRTSGGSPSASTPRSPGPTPSDDD